MAFAVTTDGYSQGAVDQALHLVLVTLNGSFIQDFETANVWFEWDNSDGTNAIEGPVRTSDGGLGGFHSYPPANDVYSYIPGTVNPGFNTQTKLTADNDYRFRSKGFYIGTSYFGAFIYFRSLAVTATQNGAMGSGSITSSSANISGNFFPNTLDSIATVKMQYRVQGSGTWLDAPGGSSDYTGYSTQNITRSLTGLVGSTNYEFQFYMTRTTVNNTTFTSTTGTFTTLASAPDILTVAASAIGFDRATLNGSVDPNLIVTRVRFGWDTSDKGSNPASWTNLTAYQAFSGDGVQTFAQTITGLSTSSTYFFRAFVEWPDPTYASGASGVTFSFTTTTDPGATARRAQMPREITREAQYGVARTFYFNLEQPAATDPDRWFNSASPLAVGDVKISIDGAVFANVNTLPTRVDLTRFKWDAIAAEMLGTDIEVAIVDQTTPCVFRDMSIKIETKKRWGQVLIRADQIGGSASAVTIQPSAGGRPVDAQNSAGTGAGLVRGIHESGIVHTSTLASATASTAVLGSGSSATDDAYNDSILLVIEGLGAGQARAIKDYVGGTKTVSVARNWDTTPNNTSVVVVLTGPDVWDLVEGAEPTAALANNDAWRKIFQHLKRRRFSKSTQNATTQTLFRDDSATTLVTRTVSDDGTTQTQGKYS